MADATPYELWNMGEYHKALRGKQGLPFSAADLLKERRLYDLRQLKAAGTLTGSESVELKNIAYELGILQASKGASDLANTRLDAPTLPSAAFARRP